MRRYCVTYFSNHSPPTEAMGDVVSSDCGASGVRAYPFSRACGFCAIAESHGGGGFLQSGGASGGLFASHSFPFGAHGNTESDFRNCNISSDCLILSVNEHKFSLKSGFFEMRYKESKVKASILSIYVSHENRVTLIHCLGTAIAVEYSDVGGIYMKSFRSFASSEKAKAAAESNRSDSTPDCGEIGSTAEEKVTAERLTQQIAAAYRGKSGKNVLADILASAEQGKKEGTLTNEEIDEFYRRFAPSLNFVQKKKLKEIVDRLKKI